MSSALLKVNPLVVQFWLFGIDAARGDLTARGFARLPRPPGTQTSVYVLGGLSLHGYGLWLIERGEMLVYRRPRQGWYRLHGDPSALEPARLSGRDGSWCGGLAVEPLTPADGLAAVRPLVLEHEAWVADRRGPSCRDSLLAGRLPAPVKRAKAAWLEWAQPDEGEATPDLARPDLIGAFAGGTL